MLLSILLFACQEKSLVVTTTTNLNMGSKPSESSVDESDTTDVDTGPMEFYADIRPIFDRACNQCHWEEGRSFNMISHEFALAWDHIIARDVRDGGKPPPTANPECASYRGDAWHVTESDKLALEQWVADGSIVGNPDSASTYQHWPTSTAPYDMTLAPPEGFPIPTTEGYKCFSFDVPDNNQTLESLQFYTDNEEIIHHSVIYFSQPDWTPPENSNQGFSCGYSGQQGWIAFAGWRPGSPIVEFTAGQGVTVSTSQKIILQVYYTPPINTDPNTFMDLNPEHNWGVHLMDTTPSQPIDLSLIEHPGTFIPADETYHTESTTQVWQNGSARLLGILPKSHILGVGIDISIERADGTKQCLMQQQGYDFGMPHILHFTEEIYLEQGDIIHLACHYDNSTGNDRQFNDPPGDIRAGYDDQLLGICNVTLLTTSL